MTPSVAVLGCGHWGKNLVRNFRDLGALALVCDPDPRGRETARRLAPGVPVTADLADVWRSDVKGVVIAAPAEQHGDLALTALEAGKDVFVEKPLTLRDEEGARMVDTAARRGAVLMVGHLLEYHPAVRAALACVRAGEIGRLRYLTSTRHSFGQVRRAEDVLWSFAPHDLAVCLRFADALPVEVQAWHSHLLRPDVADQVSARLTFGGAGYATGTLEARISVSWLHPVKEQRLLIVGEEGAISFDDVAKTLTRHPRRVQAKGSTFALHKGEDEAIPFASEEPLRLECEAFLHAVKTRTPPLTDGASGLRVLRVLTRLGQPRPTQPKVMSSNPRPPLEAAP